GRGGTLRVKRLERELSKSDELCAATRGAFHRREAAADVVRFVGSGMLLDERDPHAAIIAAKRLACRLLFRRASPLRLPTLSRCRSLALPVSVYRARLGL